MDHTRTVSCLWSIAQDAYHAQKYNNHYIIPFVLYDVVHMCTPSRGHEGLTNVAVKVIGIEIRSHRIRKNNNSFDLKSIIQ